MIVDPKKGIDAYVTAQVIKVNHERMPYFNIGSVYDVCLYHYIIDGKREDLVDVTLPNSEHLILGVERFKEYFKILSTGQCFTSEKEEEHEEDNSNVGQGSL